MSSRLLQPAIFDTIGKYSQKTVFAIQPAPAFSLTVLLSRLHKKKHKSQHERGRDWGGRQQVRPC